MSAKARQLFELTTAGRRHRVEIIEGALRREITWFVDDERVAVKKSSDEKVQLAAGVGVGGASQAELGLVALRFTVLGRPRRVTWYEAGDDASSKAAISIGGIDLDPEPGSPAARHEQRVRDHPRRYAAQHTAAGVLKVVVPLVLVYLLARLTFSLPLPDVNLPSLPAPDLPSLPQPDWSLPDWVVPGWLLWILDKVKYVWPVVLAFVLARAEINRRRKQDELKAAMREKANERDD